MLVDCKDSILWAQGYRLNCFKATSCLRRLSIVEGISVDLVWTRRIGNRGKMPKGRTVSKSQKNHIELDDTPISSLIIEKFVFVLLFIHPCCCSDSGFLPAGRDISLRAVCIRIACSFKYAVMLWNSAYFCFHRNRTMSPCHRHSQHRNHCPFEYVLRQVCVNQHIIIPGVGRLHLIDIAPRGSYVS